MNLGSNGFPFSHTLTWHTFQELPEVLMKEASILFVPKFYIYVSWSVGPNGRGQCIPLPVGHWVPSTASVMWWTLLTHFEWDFGVNIVLSVYDNKFFFTCLSFQCPPIPILSGWRQIVQTEARCEFSLLSPVSAKPQLINQLDSTLPFRFKTIVKFSKSQPGSSVLCLLFTHLASGIWHHHSTAFYTFPPLIFLYTPCVQDMNFMTTSWYFSMLWGPFSLHLCIPKTFPSSRSVFPIVFIFYFIEFLFNWITLRSHYIPSLKCFLFYRQLFNQA